jgi:hypothetical protein
MSSRFWARDFPTQASAVEKAITSEGDDCGLRDNIVGVQEKSGRLTHGKLLDWHFF